MNRFRFCSFTGVMSRRYQNEGGDNDLSDGELDDEDDDFDEDMEALRRACKLSGTNPPSSLVAGDDSFDASKSNSDSDEIDDLQLVRDIQSRFSIPADECQPLSLKPLNTLLPVSPDEDEDDFETLRAIQRRFAAYESDPLIHNMNKPNQSCDFDRTVETESFNKTVVDKQTSLERSSIFNYGKASLPKAALVFVDAIKKNRSQQKFIRSKMIHLEARLEENKTLRKRFKILKDFQVSCRRRIGCALSQKKDPRFRLISAHTTGASKDSSRKEKRLSAVNYGPAENSHVANYRMALEKFPLSVDRKKWSNVERENLVKGIKRQFQEMALQILVDQIGGPQGFSGDSNDVDNIIDSIKELDITPEKIREFLPKVNWDKLASMYIVGRSGSECEARWLNFEDPLINQNSWTALEDKNLLFIIQQKGINNWIDIAVSLSTNRTPFQCLSRYQRSLNASILKREWTKDEDEKLRSAVGAFGVGDWQAVASTLDGRAGTQCSNRWKKSLDPAMTKRGSFTPDEDNRLKIAVLLFGPKNWNRKAEFLPGRNQVQCRERWFNCLDPSLRRGEWTEEEDLRLEIAIQEHGYSWAKVAACVPSRTDNDCRRRWKKLFPNEVPLLQEARRIQKAALISNFVDRESERPALGPADFRPLPNTNLLCDAKAPAKRDMKSRRMPVSRKEKTLTGDAPMKTRSNKHRRQGDGMTSQVEITNKSSSVPMEVKSKKPRRKLNEGAAYTTKRKRVSKNTERCTEQNSNTGSLELHMNGRESERINCDCTGTVDENGTEVCENTVAQKLSEREVCFSEQEENQDSTGSSGVSVLSETTTGMDRYNPSILPDAAASSITNGNDNTKRSQTLNLPSKRKADLDLADSNSFSSPSGCLEFRITDGEGVNSHSINKIISNNVDRLSKPQRAKASKKKQVSSIFNQPVVLEGSGTLKRCHNKSKKRKLEGTDTSQSGTVNVIESLHMGGAGHPSDARPILSSRENGNFGLQSCSLEDSPTGLAGVNEPEILDSRSSNIGQDSSEVADDSTLVSFLRKKLKRSHNKKANGNPPSISLEVDKDDCDFAVASFLMDKLKKRKHRAP